MKAQQLFSEMAERTKATEWEDRLLRANVLTASECCCSRIEFLEARFAITFQRNPYVMSSKEDLLSFTEYVGSELKKKKFCFDMLIRVLYDNARRAGLNENGLKRQLQETLLKGLEASIK